MNDKYLGKICPYCRYVIKNDFNVKACPLCDMPHHIECWQENRGCTTIGCKCQSTRGWKEDNLRLVIDLDDLLPEDSLSSSGDRFDKSVFNNKHKHDSLLNNPLAQLVLAGLIGGVVTWFLAILIFDFDYYANISNYKQVLIEIAFFASVLGGVIGASLSSVEGITGKVTSKLISGLISGLIIGAVGGFIGAIIGQIFYSSIDSADMLIISRYAIRGVFWGLVGIFIGISQGVGSGGGKRINNGIVGGLIGGFVAGFLFDIFFLWFSSATLSGFLAITIFGLFTGIAIGTVQEISKEAWFKVLEGETVGKEYVIFDNYTSIGSDSRCSIVLINDSSVDKKHAEILITNNAYIIKSIDGASETWLGNRKVIKDRLHNRDVISIGNHKLQFFEK